MGASQKRKNQRAPAPKLLLDRDSAPMMVVDAETLGFLEVNQAAIDKYGYSRANFRRMRLTDLVSPEDRSRLDELMGKDSHAPPDFCDIRHVLKNGQAAH